ncbi:SCO family protein [Povalibacter sp.]|uniref:SCO family protein n=1 Tax=Povalibacter sp. TaxID=1962978 RepID=UPI002F3FD98C
MSRKQSIAVAAVVAIVAIASGMLLARSILNPRGPVQLGLAQATLLEPARPLPAFSLVDQDNATFDDARLKNRWSLLFFGFTHCPDVCPTTLGVLAQSEKSLADLPEAERPQIVLVSVDPKRDTPAQLASYVKFFSPSFTGVTGSQEDIDAFTRALGVPVAISPLPNGDYTVDHSAAIFLVNPQGQLRALISGPHTATVLADDYRRIVEAG